MPFEMFVVLAEMRTGSNFLEANLNALDGVICHGEAFNTHFIGYPNRDGILGIGRDARDAAPADLLDAIRRAPGLNGFRYFHDHDPRVIDPLLDDPAVAKVVLTRNPIESYVSRKIAAETGQWKLTNARNARPGKAAFDAAEFEAHLAGLQEFQVRVLNRLQTTGQTAFYVDYEDLQDLAVMNGLATWLGVPARLDALDRKLKKQNPDPLEEKVADFPAMQAALSRIDRFNLSRTPNFEPRRGPQVPSYLAAAESPLLYLPIGGAPVAEVTDWLTALDGAAPASGFTWGSLRRWKGARPGHRTFTVIRHPLERAHAAFCGQVIAPGDEGAALLRRKLRNQMGLDFAPEGEGYGPAEHRAGFLAFLGFLRANLANQTNLRVDPAWASQAAVLQGMADFGVPDAVLREDELARDLPWLAGTVGRPAPDWTPPDRAERRLLAQIHDEEVEEAGQAALGRDYLAFGFGPWRG
ncbi:nodulation protein NodH [Wenxinia saemankumensis]|uniref:LPS sulfotransferase NodH n=1 Tax=Wenxinia saemankumensis TaxID=1447782 RepID=A0A1M6FSG0_9RHOB|nr:nodulation protein NodH [Wenxinia saemankumensis]SHJ00617.1 hypothetical protein SAMN05444417_2476 [Wenxinia saemankumensis]